MRLQVECAECLKKGKVLILFKHIFSRKWWWFGKVQGVDPDTHKKVLVDYWECEDCR